MNWTGGQLHRHSRLHRTKTRRRGKHHLTGSSLSLNHSRRSSLPRSVLTTQAKPTRQHLSNARSPHEDHPQSTPDDCSIQVQAGFRMHQAHTPSVLQSCAPGNQETFLGTKDFDTVKRDLLGRSDWLGVSVAKPLQIRFTPVKERESIARHRTVSTKPRIHAQVTPLRHRESPQPRYSPFSPPGLDEYLIWNRPVSMFPEHSIRLPTPDYGERQLQLCHTPLFKEDWSSQLPILGDAIAPRSSLDAVEEVQGFSTDELETCVVESLPSLDSLRSFQNFDEIKALRRTPSRSVPQTGRNRSSTNSEAVTLNSGIVGVDEMKRSSQVKLQDPHITSTPSIGRPPSFREPNSRSKVHSEGNCKTLQPQTYVVTDTPTHDQTGQRSPILQLEAMAQVADKNIGQAEHDLRNSYMQRSAHQYKYLNFDHETNRTERTTEQAWTRGGNRMLRFPALKNTPHLEDSFGTISNLAQQDGSPFPPLFAPHFRGSQTSHSLSIVHSDEPRSLFSSPFPRMVQGSGPIRNLLDEELQGRACQIYQSHDKSERRHGKGPVPDSVRGVWHGSHSTLLSCESARCTPYAEKRFSTFTPSSPIPFWPSDPFGRPQASFEARYLYKDGGVGY